MFGAEVWDPNRAQRLFNAPLCVSTVNMTFVKTLLQLGKFDKEGKSSSGFHLPAQKWFVGQGGTAWEAPGTPPPENLCGSEHSLSKHWPQLAAGAGQEFIFISWNSVDLKSLLNVNFQKAHASAF